jgi:hypothetical protein
MRQTAEAIELRHERTRSLENGSIGRGDLHGIDHDFSLMLVVLVDQVLFFRHELAEFLGGKVDSVLQEPVEGDAVMKVRLQ